MMSFFAGLDATGVQYSQENAILEAMARDWTTLNAGLPLAVVFPTSTEEVRQVLMCCSQHGVAVVPSGGRTGLAGGACSQGQDIILSLEKMNTIHRVDPVDMLIDVDAGVITQQVQDSAREVGLMFPLDLAAKGSSQIGGNLATNAGGLKFIAFGGAREQVLGLEVVLMNGQVLELGHGLRKNNTGYDLQGLFVGSEGTLGVITRAQLRLVLPTAEQDLVCFGVESFANIQMLLTECCKHQVQLSAFEFFTRQAHEITLQINGHRLKTPFAEKPPFFVLLESAMKAELESVMEKGFEEGWLLDGVLATSNVDKQQLWDLRESITESLAVSGRVHKNDVSLQLTHLPTFVEELECLEGAIEDIQIVLFGHIGDGNIHINYLGPKAMTQVDFYEKVRQIELKVFEKVQALKGSISAEHGIGVLKKADLNFSRTPEEITLMREIKKIFDPSHLLNPGKIF